MTELITLENNQSNQLAFLNNKNYDFQINKFNKWLVDKKKVLNAKSILEYLNLISLGRSSSTLYVSKAALKKALLETYKKESYNLIFRNEIDKLFSSVSNIKTDKKVYHEKVLTKPEMKKLIEETPNKKISLIIEMLCLTGLRISELINIKHADVNVVNDFAYINILGKGKKERRIFIPLGLYQRIFGLKGNIYLFENNQGDKFSREYLHRTIKKLGKRIIDKDIHPHTFRHSFATHKIKEKGSVKAVSNYLGHSSTAITEKMYHHDELTTEDIKDFFE